jgi:hypothetical protein
VGRWELCESVGGDAQSTFHVCFLRGEYVLVSFGGISTELGSELKQQRATKNDILKHRLSDSRDMLPALGPDSNRSDSESLLARRRGRHVHHHTIILRQSSVDVLVAGGGCALLGVTG